jgi:thiamine-phosphate diphosphorylase
VTASAERRPGSLPRLHLVTDDSILASPEFDRLAARLLERGGPAVALHLRGRLRGGEFWRRAAACGPSARAAGAALIVNDRIDVALACEAAGVQLGSGSFSVEEARRLIGPRAWIGVSIHSSEEAEDAVARGADYLLAGTLFQTPSHPERSGAGTTWLRDLRALGRPVLGIGGIRPDRVGEILEAGAWGVAVVRGVWLDRRPVEALSRFLDALAQHSGG